MPFIVPKIRLPKYQCEAERDDPRFHTTTYSGNFGYSDIAFYRSTLVHILYKCLTVSLKQNDFWFEIKSMMMMRNDFVML